MKEICGYSNAAGESPFLLSHCLSLLVDLRMCMCGVDFPIHLHGVAQSLLCLTVESIFRESALCALAARMNHPVGYVHSRPLLAV